MRIIEQIQKGRLSGRMLWGENQNLDMRRGKDPGFCFLSSMPSARWAVISVLCWKAASVSFVLWIATEPFVAYLTPHTKSPFALQISVCSTGVSRPGKQLTARKTTSLACRQLPVCSFPQISEDLEGARFVFKSVLQKPPRAMSCPYLWIARTGNPAALACKRGNSMGTTAEVLSLQKSQRQCPWRWKSFRPLVMQLLCWTGSAPTKLFVWPHEVVSGSGT